MNESPKWTFESLQKNPKLKENFISDFKERMKKELSLESSELIEILSIE